MTMYADDTSLFHQSHDLTGLNEAINSDLSKLETWLQGNKLSLNVALTHSMLISSKQKQNSLKGRNETLELKIRDHELEVVQKTKYLGVQIDCSLDCKEQIKAVCTKVSSVIGFLRHAKCFLPQASLKTLYTGIVESHFRHCCSFWGTAGSAGINQLQKLQNRAARIITNSSFDTPSRPLIAELGWQTIEEVIGNESKQWSSSHSTMWLHNTGVISSRKIVHAPPAASGTLRLILSCQRESQQMGKNAFLTGDLRYGIALVMSQRQYPPSVVLRNL